MGFAAWITELLSNMAELSLLAGARRRRPDVVALAGGANDAPAARFLGRSRVLKS